MSQIPRFHIRAGYIAGDRIHYTLSSCVFQLRARAPDSGIRERIRLIEYFPALQRISDQCLETTGAFDGGTTDVGNHFWASLGADRLFAGNGTVGSGGIGETAGIGVVTA